MDMDSDFVQGPNRRRAMDGDSPEIPSRVGTIENIPVLPRFLWSCCLAAPRWRSRRDYSIRDAGFVDFAPKPYRLMMRAKDPTAPDVQKIEAALRSDIVRSNIVLVSIPSSGKNAAVGAKDKHAAPEFRCSLRTTAWCHSIRRGHGYPAAIADAGAIRLEVTMRSAWSSCSNRLTNRPTKR